MHGPHHKLHLKEAVQMATRPLRLKKALATLGPQRKLAALVEELRLLGERHGGGEAVPSEGQVVVPAAGNVRSPVLLLIGGGMAAGKSTVVKEVMAT